jgi:hypothetical protein
MMTRDISTPVGTHAPQARRVPECFKLQAVLLLSTRVSRRATARNVRHGASKYSIRVLIVLDKSAYST